MPSPVSTVETESDLYDADNEDLRVEGTVRQVTSTNDVWAFVDGDWYKVDGQPDSDGLYPLVKIDQTTLPFPVLYSAPSLDAVAAEMQTVLRTLGALPSVLFTAEDGRFVIRCDDRAGEVRFSDVTGSHLVGNLLGFDGSESLSFAGTYPLETAAGCLSRVTGTFDDFGSFCVPSAGPTSIRDIAFWNASRGRRQLYSASCRPYETSAAAATTEIHGSCFTVTAIGDGSECAIPMARFAATDYRGRDTVGGFVFTTAAVPPIGLTESEADDIVADGCNFYGLVKVYGVKRSFYQPGLNTDGEDTAAYCAELWLRNAIEAAILDRFLSSDRLPSTPAAVASVTATIRLVCSDAVANGMFVIGRQFQFAERESIDATIGESGAHRRVTSDGYALACSIKDRATISYTLVYATRDSVKTIRGTSLVD